MKDKLRIQFELSEDKFEELEALRGELKVTTKKDLLNNALTLLEWVVEQKKGGRTIAALDEKKNSYKELVMPILSGLSAPKKTRKAETRKKAHAAT